MQSEKEMVDSTLQQDVDEQKQVEHEEIHQDELLSSTDLSNHTKEALLQELLTIQVEGNFQSKYAFLREIKDHYDELIEVERNEALQHFVSEGGNREDFELKKDQTTIRFEKLFNKLKTEITEKIALAEHEKEKNLQIKQQILDKLRELTSGEESSASLQIFKDLQAEWKAIGSVPTAYNKELWANYNALVEMFYNNRSIYFELKELDRKKNLEAKIEVVEKAEKLSEEISNIPETVRELRKLHEEYKNLGPVPKENQDILWTRFKTASDNIYDKRKGFLELAKGVQEENLKKKEDLIEKVKPFTTFQTEKINEWKGKTNEILDLQNEWNKIGAVSKEHVKAISKQFWGYYKSFFKNKDHFFKDLEVQKKVNLEKKIALCEQVEALKESEAMDKTTETIKQLQVTWNNIGPIPVKQKEELFKRFKGSCDYFFTRKRVQYAEQEQEYVLNLNKKEAVIQQIEELAAKNESTPEKISALQKEFSAIGFVPKKEVKYIREKFKNAVEKYLKEIGAQPGNNIEKLKLELELSALKADPAARKKLSQKESGMLRKMNELKSDIQTLTTNVEFLANSPKATKLKEQVLERIEVAKTELEGLKEQLNIIRKNR